MKKGRSLSNVDRQLLSYMEPETVAQIRNTLAVDRFTEILLESLGEGEDEEEEPLFPAPGSIVRLKSGGPPMTILSIVNGLCACSWFDEKYSYQTDDFPPEALAPLTDGEIVEWKAKGRIS